MKYILIVSYLLLISNFGFGQQLDLRYQEKPLNEILLDLRDRYDCQFSFDDAKLSTYRVSVKQTFRTTTEALDVLLKDLPLDYEKAGEVFLIFNREVLPVSRIYRISGLAMDANNGESLPFAYVRINEKGLITDQNGAFSFRSDTDSTFQISISYLGYYLIDTLVAEGLLQQFNLKPSLVRLKEIRVEGVPIVRSVQIGQQAGEIRLNHQVAQSLPGYGDNSVFNLLRLQPGILAAGEQSNDLIIRGSYEGQSQVLFDGFTLFGMKNFNDNISAVNPFMAKDIRVMKGGFAAEYGDRVGGIVQITGVYGNPDDWQMQLSVNNMTMNGWLSVPLGGNTSLVMAVRQTYYELYEKNQLTLGSSGRSGRGSTIDRYVYPDYNFGDLNAKLSGKTDGGDFYSFSFFRGHDRYVYGLEYETQSQRNRVEYEDKEKNLQYGASAQYSKAWAKGLRTQTTVAYSSLETEVFNLRESSGQQGGTGGSGGNGQGNGGNDLSGDTGNTTSVWNTDVDDFNRNKISEFRFELRNHLPLHEKHRLGFGFGLLQNEIHFQEDSFNLNLAREKNRISRMHVYLEDHFTVFPQLQLIAGLRSDLVPNLNRTDWQPRISANYELSKSVRVTASWGTYRQYISRTSVIDALGNYRYLWAACNDSDIPVLWSRQAIAGISWNRSGFLFSVEAYRKHTKGLSRYIDVSTGSGLFRGDAKTSGLDFFLKKDWEGHSFWVTYTLSETKEHFSYFESEQYQPALHDQRHELKTAAVLNFEPFFLSANYVFGSGFPGLLDDSSVEGRPYHRFDTALSYRWIKPKYSMEAGISILNVFNYENIKYANFVRIPDDQEATLDVSAEAVPFTPTVFLKLAF
ncbi:TonB-dependent receptor plug domain-containing protein [Mangrovibacterium sp.]|uniref:TonB-dependent receptor plug domain-containing protein n=1 Tax=Mangrovibacterium sp. TaxID=1961364 RepID=UPI0035665792